MKKCELYYYILIFIINSLNIQSLQFLKTIHITDDYYYMFTAENLYYYNDGNSNKDNLYTFKDDQIITTYEESEMIIQSLFKSDSIYLLMVKHYLYITMYSIYCYNNRIEK